MRDIVFTVVVTLLVVLLIGTITFYWLVRSGSYNIAATKGHYGFVRWTLHTTTQNSISKHAENIGQLDLPADSAALQKGFKAFQSMCIKCHGAPGVERGWIGKGLLPEPPDLDRVAKEKSGKEIYWVIKHGIKMAGMPALAPTHSEAEIKQIAAFVTVLDDMSPAQYKAWRARSDSLVGSDSTVTGHGHEHTH